MSYLIFTIIHVASGAGSLLAGLWAMSVQKGSRNHRIAGKVFAVSLVLTSVTALVLSVIRTLPFLFTIGLFTLYLVLSGWSYANRKMTRLMAGSGRIAAGVFGLVAAAGLGIQWVFSDPGFRQVLPVFFVLQCMLAFLDFRPLKKPADRIPRHIGRMGGAYISSVTAFLVVSVEFLPGLVRWFGPTIIGVFLIRHALRKYKKGASPLQETPYPKTD